MKHRTDIDGLRALAIVPVVLYHYGYKQIAPGGFTGVDIFFVISGFLITRNIHDDILAQRYSVLDFYHRRIRRIFPALFAMFLACLVGAVLFEFPGEAATTSKGILASVVFVSNILFYRTNGYFDQAAQTDPVLHTWSLSVEEQFYVVMPCVLLLISGLPARRRLLLVYAALAASLLAACIKVLHDESAAFFLVQYRAWELLAGSVLAMGGVAQLRSRLAHEALGVAGLVLILAGITLLTEKSVFPGAAALLPCAGAALILYSGMDGTTLTGRLLSVYPLRFIGFISYSLYLWHWPIFVFYRGYEEPHKLAKLLLLVLSFAVAALSWRFIEQPFRLRTATPARPRRMLAAAGAAAAAVAVLALAAVPLNPLLWRYPAPVTSVLAYLDYDPAFMRGGSCFLYSAAPDLKFYQAPHCLKIDPARKNYLLIGDSHAAHFWYGLQTAYPNINFLQATASGCKPFNGAPGLQYCRDLRNYVFSDFIAHHHLDGIIISARWNEDEISGAVATAKGFLPYADHVMIFGPSAEYDEALPRLLARDYLAHDAGILRRHMLPAQAGTDAEFAARLAGTNVQYVSVYQAMCPGGACMTTIGNGIPLQFDSQHFLAPASVVVAQRLNLGGANRVAVSD